MLDLGNIGGDYKSDLYNEIDYDASVYFINNLLSDMQPVLTSRQLNELQNVVLDVMEDYSISLDGELSMDIPYTEFNTNLLNTFIEDKRLIGLSEKTITFYESELNRFFEYTGRSVDSITADDIRDYFEYQLEVRKVTPITVDNIRRIFNSFWNYCVVNGLLYKNPCRRIDKIKGKKEIKKPFSNNEIIIMREHFKDIREEAIFELLISSGMRIGELISLNRTDLNFEECSVIVTGKGNKQRECFFNDLSKHKIQKYLSTRDDDNPALFVSLNKNAPKRLKISGAERMVRELGQRAGVSKVHPHRFRRTFATRMLHKGVPIDQIQKFLGHAQIETTQLYASSNDDELEYNIKRYVN